MKINLSPVFSAKTLELTKDKNTLTVNGELFDFTRMVDGETLPASAIVSDYFFDKVDNIQGELEVTIMFPIPEKYYSPEQAFPTPLLNVPDGLVELPKPLPDPLPPTQESLEMIQPLMIDQESV